MAAFWPQAYKEALVVALLEGLHMWIRGTLQCPPPHLKEGMQILDYASSVPFIPEDVVLLASSSGSD